LFLLLLIRKRAKEAIEKYYHQLTEGCGRLNCSNTNCASNSNFKKLSNNEAAALAIHLAKNRGELCELTPTKAAKQFKPNSTTTSNESSFSSSVQPSTSNGRANSSILMETDQHQPLSSAQSYEQDEQTALNVQNSNQQVDRDEDIIMTVNNSSQNENESTLPKWSAISDSVAEVIATNVPAATSSKSSGLESLNDALRDAVKFVAKINENPSTHLNDKSFFLTENKIVNAIRKLKSPPVSSSSSSHNLSSSFHSSSFSQFLADDTVKNSKFEANESGISSFKNLIKYVGCVFQNYKFLALSFTKSKNNEVSKTEIDTMPTIEPFDIDISSARRSYSILFNMIPEELLEELEKSFDSAVYTLCASVRMLFKKSSEISEPDMNEIIHSMLIINELPLLDDPRYMDRCSKMFYTTMSELPLNACAKIVRLWSRWHADELRVYLNRIQQYITVCVISKNLDEEPNQSDENDEDSIDSDNSLHKHEGITGAVGCLRLIFYASILGGRLDDMEQIRRERDLEQEEIRSFESSSNENGNASYIDSEAIILRSYMSRVDPLEELLFIRPIDCRQPLLPLDLFKNEVANKYVNIQKDYVEYVQHLQNLNSEMNFAHSTSNSSNIRLSNSENNSNNENTSNSRSATNNSGGDSTRENLNANSINNSNGNSQSLSTSVNNRTSSGGLFGNGSSTLKKQHYQHIFSFLSHPFFLNLSKKNLGLYYDNKIKMMRERRNNIVMSYLVGTMPSPYFKLRLSRQNLLFEVLNVIELQEQEDSTILRKQLFIEFENEQGIDQGGVSKEFFQLTIDELLNKGYSKNSF
jgi:hypothetical protein